MDPTDDSMLSTPSSHDDEETFDEIDENMIPDNTIPPNDHLNAAAPGELSPPRTTHGPTEYVTVISDDEVEIDQQKPVVEERKPGAGWKNKKAQDEMQRSWEYIVDKDFDGRIFGDVLNVKGKGTQ